jgi:AbrB family looped-hinge helix DNA binding protein
MRNTIESLPAERSQPEMPLVKIKRFAQVTLPPEVRKKFNLAEGDYLEAEAVKDGILLKPVAVVEKQEAWGRLFAAAGRVRPERAKSRQTPREQEEEIAEVAREVRKGRRA